MEGELLAVTRSDQVASLLQKAKTLVSSGKVIFSFSLYLLCSPRRPLPSSLLLLPSSPLSFIYLLFADDNSDCGGRSVARYSDDPGVVHATRDDGQHSYMLPCHSHTKSRGIEEEEERGRGSERGEGCGGGKVEENSINVCMFRLWRTLKGRDVSILFRFDSFAFLYVCFFFSFVFISFLTQRRCNISDWRRRKRRGNDTRGRYRYILHFTKIKRT